MNPSVFIVNAGVLVAAMAVLAIIESFFAFRASNGLRRVHAFANISLFGIYLALNFTLYLLPVFAAPLFAAGGLGLFAIVELPASLRIIAGVVLLDFFSYAGHWLMHKAPWLWNFHRVHHSDPFVDVTTAFRQHPFEGLFRFAFTIIPAVIAGVPVEGIVIYRLLSAINALLEHANLSVPLALDQRLSVVYVTPNMHKVHHSRDQIETDSNYGNILSVFDRLFGTFTPTPRSAVVEYGLIGFDRREVQNLGALLLLPFVSHKAGAQEVKDGMPADRKAT